MNLAQMLQQEVVPLSERSPACQVRQKKAQADKVKVKRCLDANIAKREQAIARYKAVMRDEWTPTRTIETRLGMERSSCLGNLNKWESMGLIVSRKAGEPGKWNRAKGYEWRWRVIAEVLQETPFPQPRRINDHN